MSSRLNTHFKLCLALLTLAMMLTSNAVAQFSSGSTGADGALDYTGKTGTFVFDPTQFNPSLHPPGQNVYNFTTITIPSTVTLVLSSQSLTGPVFWLAQGDVHIDGFINVSGHDGPAPGGDPSLRVPAAPGPGGYAGGVGGIAAGVFKASPAGSGFGPGGGAAGVASSFHGNGGTFTGSFILAPLVGGSGGGGAFCPNGSIGDGGGGGGGALAIASSTSIFLTGTIDARGGAGGCNCGGAGSGAGGAVKLVANTVSGNGQGVIRALGGGSCVSGTAGATGAIQLEAANLPITGIGADITETQAAPGALFLPTTPTSIQIVSVGGVPVANPPGGRFTNPDVVINTSSPVTIVIQTSGIPVGTVLNLNVYSEDGTTQTVQTTPLQGSVQSATASASVTFPPDLSLGSVKAVWTQQ
jgi:hypothetical protein